jgi:PKD domain
MKKQQKIKTLSQRSHKGGSKLLFSRKNLFQILLAFIVLLMLLVVSFPLSEAHISKNGIKKNLSQVPQPAQYYPIPHAQFTHVYYNDSVSVNSLSKGDDTPLTLYWSFGDGTNLTGGNSHDHTYTADGNYTVQLKVVDSNGDMNIMAKLIEVVIVYPSTPYNASDPNSQGITIDGVNIASVLLVSSLGIIAILIKLRRSNSRKMRIKLKINKT